LADDIEIVIGAQDKASAVIDGLVGKVGSFSSSFAVLGPVAAGVTAALGSLAAGFMSVSAAMDSITEAANRIDALTDVANGLGESVPKLQAFQFAMSEAGNVSAEKSIQALQKIQKAVGEVASGGGNQELFAKLGLDASQLSMQGPVDQFLAVKEAIAGIENISERAAVAQQLLGKSAADLIPALISEQAAFEESMGAAADLGATVSEDGAAGIASMNDAIGRVMAGFEGLANVAAAAVAPAVQAIADVVAEWLPPIIDLAKQYLPAMVDMAIVMAGNFADMVTAAYRFATLDFSGALSAFNANTGAKMLEEVRKNRDQAAADALANAEKAKAITEATRDVDEQALRDQEAKAAAAAKTVEQLERALLVAQLGEDAVKQQEQLATATNDAERERIRLLQEQIAAQEAINKQVEDAKKAEEEAIKSQQKAMEEQAKEEQQKAEKIANFQPGTQAVESRTLTRGPMEKGIDKVAVNTDKANTKLDDLIVLFTNFGGTSEIVVVN